MCRIIHSINKYKEEEKKKKPVNLAASLFGSPNIDDTEKNMNIDLDISSDDDLPLMMKIKKRLSVSLKANIS